MNLHWGIETLILVAISVAYLRYAVYIYDKYWSQGRQVATYLILLLSTICFVLCMYIMNDSFNVNPLPSGGGYNRLTLV